MIKKRKNNADAKNDVNTALLGLKDGWNFPFPSI
jgi:hypothetical protein